MFDDKNKDRENLGDSVKPPVQEGISQTQEKQPPHWDDVPIFDEPGVQTYGEHGQDDPVETPSMDTVDMDNDLPPFVTAEQQEELIQNTNADIESTIPTRTETAEELNGTFLNDIRQSVKSTKFKSTSPKRKVLIVGLGVFAVLLIGSFSGIFSNTAVKSDIAVPVVQASAVIKEVPIDPQGMEIEHLDKVVYGAVNEVTAQADEKVEKLLPKIEKPIVIETAPIKKINKAKVASKKVVTKKAVVVKKTTKKIAPNKINSKAKPVKAKITPAPKKASISVGKNVGKSWRVQLASVGSVADAKKVYAKRLAKFSVLKGSKLYIQSAKVKGKVYHRVQAVGFTTKSQAVKVCNFIKVNGGQCLVKKP